ncbi:discoidin domain-containing protein [Streptomyces graminifolii]|uniref:discoidin domain-containing protein n=1 Tax=Streptomyces graminifolii TaxID=1266771 RepID=UPI0040587751
MPPSLRKSWAAVCAATLTGGLLVGIGEASSVSALPAAAPNLALNRPVTVSSSETADLGGARAVDGSVSTRWASLEGSDDQWLQVDLGATTSLSRVVLKWEAAYASGYRVELSDNGSTWRQVYSTTAGDGGTDDVSVSGTGRYLRVQGTKRATAWGYSLFEVEAYAEGGTAPTDPPTDPPPSGPVVNVSTTAELKSALAAASPGQTINLAPGAYHGSFVTQRSGTASQPITLAGPRSAVLVNDGPVGEPTGSCPAPADGFDSGYGLWLFKASNWKLSGFTVADSKKGIVLDTATKVAIDNVYVHDIDEEGVHFRRSSADGVIQNSTIEKTGLVQPGYGEGVYIGSSNSNFACYADSTGVDASHRVQVIGNRIGPNVAAESIDIKEGTTGGVIRGNTFNGTGITGENSGDSWIDAKGNNYTIENNTGTFSAPGTFANGYETHNLLTGYGCGNVWRNNKSDLGGAGEYAVYVSSVSKCATNPNVVYSSNTVTNAKKGLTNITVTP